jgi:hypothetical protein
MTQYNITNTPPHGEHHNTAQYRNTNKAQLLTTDLEHQQTQLSACSLSLQVM